MDSPIEELRRRARLLQRRVRAGDPPALRRIRAIRELRPLSDEAIADAVRRRHCLAVLARELGLSGWSHLSMLWSSPDTSDFGTLLYPSRCGGHWNIWCASFDEARDIRAQHGGYLLPYRHQLFIVDRHFIADLGLDPDDADWERIARDWARPMDAGARHRLLRALLRTRVEALT